MTKTTMIAAGAVVCAGLVLSGCGLRTIASPTKEHSQTYDVTGGRVGALDVQTGAGDIEIVRGTGKRIRVTETMHWKSEQPKSEHPVDGGTLRLSYECARDDWNCGVDYRVELPDGMSAKLRTGSGDITLRSVSGELDAFTGSGDIDANGLTGHRAIAETGSGDVELRFTVAPFDVQVSTGSGNATVHVPADEYNVTAETGSGSRTVDVTTDASSERRLILKTGSGDAKVLKA
ncbi:hypothetical protein GCM10009677_51080 [Sphaerisporangium rubeum]|uniref:DUF4097 and DUF4098 domain-containing protein YvlB n=1 Tax=Sphaerisporangium rubeum TaxID=321317 RepID=A0A7X0M9M5_9ACTN|nr:DUF4097 family beta strand repeat-containing protein [Sphaerisporangium rubeum]MBB6475101.1 DUF4097 and DUF4098 domain-containing protein YvlB [Sphaerisporangium rubeum]